MKTRLAVSALIFMIVQAVLFGIGTVLILATPLSEWARTLMPYVIAVSFALSAPLSWLIAPRMMARYNRPRLTTAAVRNR